MPLIRKPMTSRMFLFWAAIVLPSISAQVKPPPAPASPTPDPIPLTQIAIRGEELARTLRDISRRLPPDSDVSAFDEQLRNREEWIHGSLEYSAEAVAGRASLIEIREQLRQWREYSSAEVRDRGILTNWGAACEQSLTLLEKE